MPNIKKSAAFHVYIIGFLVVLGVAFLSYFEFYDLIENKFLDWRFQLRAPITVSDRITHVDIDDYSIAKIGRWPWPRDKHAGLLGILYEMGAKSVVFDVNFSEEMNQRIIDQKTLETLKNKLLEEAPSQDSPPEEYQKYISSLRQSIRDTFDETEYDTMFSQAIKYAKNIFLAFVFSKDPPEVSNLPPSNFRIQYSEKLHGKIASQMQYFPETPIAVLADNARGQGFVNIEPDNDGVIRHVALLKEYQGYFYPQLAFRAVCEDLGITPEMIKFTPGVKIELIKNEHPEIIIPLNNRSEVIVNWAGNSDKAWNKTFNHVSYGQILENYVIANEDSSRLPEDKINQAKVMLKKIEPLVKDKICLIGSTETASTDLKPTPIEPLVPGVMLHSNIINMVLTNDFIKRLPKLWNLVILAVFGLLITIIAGRLPPVKSAVLTVLIISLSCYAGFLVFSYYGVWVDITGPVLVCFLGFTSIKVYRTIQEEKAKRHVQHIFGHYLAPQVVEQIIKHPEKLKLGGEKRVMSVFFSDIANFTNISSKLSPEVFMEFINQYLSAMTDIIQSHYGMIDKYEGDAIMALFGAPLERDDHAKCACWSALDNIKKLTDLNEHFKKSGLPKLAIRVGINTGEMVVGNMGSQKVRSYTVMGEEVIVASRLEGINKFYQTNILISESTYEQAKNDIEARELDFVQAKGMHRPIRIYEVVGKKGEIDAVTKSLHAKYALGLEAYRAHQWDEAIKILNECRKMINPDDGPTVRILGQCHKLKRLPPGEKIVTVNILTAK